MKKRAGAALALLLVLALLGGRTPGVGSARAVNAQDEGIALPVLMYHALLRDSALWNDYVLSPDALDRDLAYLKAQGYTTVLPSQVIDYVTSGAPLPEKPVMITLDDGCFNHLTYLPDLLEKHDAVALVSVVGSYAQEADETGEENPQYSYLSSRDIRALLETGRVEIGNHSFDMHRLAQRRGAMRCAAEDMDSYRHVLTRDALWAQEYFAAQCGVKPAVYAYPYGLISDGADEILSQAGFSMTLSCFERVTRITRDAACLRSVGRFNRPAFVSTEEFMRACGL